MHATRDPLIAAIAFMAKTFDRPATETALSAALPLVNGRVSVDLIPRVAERAGLEARIERRALADLPQIVLPAIALLDHGEACVVTRIDKRRGSIHIVYPAVSEKEVTRKLADVAKFSTGYVVMLSLAGAAEAQPAAPRSRWHSWFWGPVAAFLPTYFEVAFASLVMNLIALALPIFSMNVYDRVIPNFAEPTLWALAVGVSIALGCDLLLRTLRVFIVDEVGKRADMIISARIFEHLLSISLIARPGSTGILASQIREFESVRDFFTSSTVTSIVDTLFIAVFIAVLYVLAGPLVAVLLVAIMLVLLVVGLVQIPLARAVRKSQADSAIRHAVLVEAVSGLETIKAVGGEGRMQRLWENSVLAASRSSASARRWTALATNISSTVQQLVTIGILVWGTYLVSEGEATTGTLVACSLLAGRALAPLGGITATLIRAHQTWVSLSALNRFMTLDSERPEGAIAFQRSEMRGALGFKGVSFTYPGQPVAALSEVAFSVSAGARVGIVGRMGSGKSTLGRLACGLYRPSGGVVTLDGVDLTQIDVHDLRSVVAYLPQEPELFTGTLRDNIVLGMPTATDEEVLAAARLAGVDEFASRHPQGYQMQVGERGRMLSGGQRQTVALARAMLKQPKLLVLDEPTASMDTVSEGALIARLKDVAATGVTMLVITHRSSLLALVDRLIVIDQGKVALDGPRDAVLQRLQQMASQRGDARPLGA